MRHVLLLAASMLLTSCAMSPFGQTGPGGAVYRYTKGADGTCSIEITSGREVGGGSIAIDECDLVVDATDLGGTDAALATIRQLVDILITKGVTSP